MGKDYKVYWNIQIPDYPCVLDYCSRYASKSSFVEEKVNEPFYASIEIRHFWKHAEWVYEGTEHVIGYMFKSTFVSLLMAGTFTGKPKLTGWFKVEKKGEAYGLVYLGSDPPGTLKIVQETSQELESEVGE